MLGIIGVRIMATHRLHFAGKPRLSDIEQCILSAQFLQLIGQIGDSTVENSQSLIS